LSGDAKSSALQNAIAAALWGDAKDECALMLPAP
jgi:hypothetical protein